MKATNQKKASDEELVASYHRTRSVWETSREFGMCGQSVHERLQRLNIQMDGTGKKWTPEDDAQLIREYEVYRYYGKVSELARVMGHNVYFLSRKAKELGLTTTNYKRFPRSKLKTMSNDAIRMVWNDYKTSRFKMAEYCRHHGYDDEAFSYLMRERFFDEYDDVLEAKKNKCTKYATGRAFEYRAKKHLEDKGYFVMRAPQSKGPVDLMAYNGHECLFIQCKIGDWHAVDAWNEFYDLAMKHKALPIYCTKVERGRIQFNLIKDRKDRSRKAMPMEEIQLGVKAA